MGWRRDTYVISSKVFWGGQLPNQEGLSRKHIMEGINLSLQRMQADYLDLYYCHRPDPHTPIEETVRAMTDLIRQGKILYWGTSEWSSQAIMQAYSAAREYGLVPPSVEQPCYHMFARRRVELEYERLYGEIGMGTTTFCPLAMGLLTGKYNNGVPADASRYASVEQDWLREQLVGDKVKLKIEKVKKLQEVANSLGISLAMLALAWCLRNPNVSSVITGASRPQQVVENMKAVDVFPKMTPEILERIDQILENDPRKKTDRE
jgi:voltage-dependent potassium channel beta subunit